LRGAERRGNPEELGIKRKGEVSPLNPRITGSSVGKKEKS